MINRDDAVCAGLVVLGIVVAGYFGSKVLTDIAIHAMDPESSNPGGVSTLETICTLSGALVGLLAGARMVFKRLLWNTVFLLACSASGYELQEFADRVEQNRKHLRTVRGEDLKQ